MKNSRVLNFREVMITVILSIVCGAIYWGWGPLYNVIDPIAPGASDAIYGIWFLASVLCAYIVRKPGVAIIAELAASFVEMIFGGQWGAQTLLFGLLQGLAAEIAFAIFAYRVWNLPVCLLSGVLAAAASVPIDYFQGYMGDVTTGILTLKIVIRLISGAILTGVLGALVANLLAKTGVLNSYAIIRSKQAKPF